MEMLKNLMVGLLAGDLVLWSMVLIVVLVTWVVADATILAHGMQPKLCCDDNWLHEQSRWDRLDDDSIDSSTMFGGQWDHGTNSDGTSRM
jgi:hypothetical protein